MNETQAIRLCLRYRDPVGFEFLVKKYRQRKSYEEITRLLDIPRGTVMSRLFHARKAFRKEYLKYGKPECYEAKGERNGKL